MHKLYIVDAYAYVALNFHHVKSKPPIALVSELTIPKTPPRNANYSARDTDYALYKNWGWGYTKLNKRDLSPNRHDLETYRCQPSAQLVVIGAYVAPFV